MMGIIVGLILILGCSDDKAEGVKPDHGFKFYVWSDDYVHGHIQDGHPPNPNHGHADEYCHNRKKEKPEALKKEIYTTKALVLAHEVDDYTKLLPKVKKERLADVPVYAMDSEGKTYKLSKSYNDFISKPWEKSLKELGFKGTKFWTGSGKDAKKHAKYHCDNFITDDKKKKGTYSLFSAKSSVGEGVTKKDGSPFYVGSDPKTGEVYSYSCFPKEEVSVLCMSYDKKLEE